METNIKGDFKICISVPLKLAFTSEFFHIKQLFSFENNKK